MRFRTITSNIPDDADSILDIGCTRHIASIRDYNEDRGFLHEYLYRNTSAERIVGLDVDEEGAEIFNDQGYDVRVGDAQDFDLDERFDVIVAGAVIREILDLDGFFDSVSRHLNPGGHLVVTNPNPIAATFFVRALLNKQQPGHTIRLGPANLEAVLERSGIETAIENIDYIPPIGGISALLWRLGRRDLGGPQYVARVRFD